METGWQFLPKDIKKKNKVIEFLEDILKRYLLQLDYTSYTIITMIV